MQPASQPNRCSYLARYTQHHVSAHPGVTVRAVAIGWHRLRELHALQQALVRAYEKNAPFFSTFPMVVPSLSWEHDRFHLETGPKRRFCRTERPLAVLVG